MDTPNNIQAEAKNLIAKAETAKAFNLVLAYTEKEKPAHFDEILLIYSRYNELMEKSRLNLISDEALSRELSQINYDLLRSINLLTVDNRWLRQMKSKFDYWFRFLDLIRKGIASFVILIGLIMFYFRGDVIKTMILEKSVRPMEYLFLPIFIVFMGAFIFLYKLK